MATIKPLVVFFLLLALPLAANQDFAWESAGASDFPAADSMVRSQQLMALRARAAEAALREAPDRARTLDLLLQSGRIPEGLDVLARIVSNRPDELREAFAAIGFKGREFAADRAHDYADRLRTALAAARQRFPGMPREEAARLARQMMSVEGELAIQTKNWRARAEAFVAEYAGTRTALLAEVDLLTDRIGPQMLEPLDAFIAAHPGTEAAAKALYQKGFHLGHNPFGFGWKVGNDPTDRFLQVLSIYRELRSARYPASEWLEKAPTLITGFSAYKATYEAANIDRVLAGYEEVLPVLLAAYERNSLQDSVSLLIGYRMAELFKLKGNLVGGVDATFDRLEQMAKEPYAVRMLRADLYLRPNDTVFDAASRAELKAKAVPLLEAVTERGAGLVRRRAHATLATLHFSENRLVEAGRLYRRFVEAYPTSEYAWVAALRAAECEEPANPAGAAARFREAAQRYQSNPVARILGHAYAARASEAAGDFGAALADYRRALAAWDGRYGTRMSLYSRRQELSGEPFMTRDVSEVVKEQLPQRIATLERTLLVPGGALIERARRAIAQQSWDAASAAAADFLAKHASSPLGAEARSLGSRARLEKALDLADSDKADARIAAAIGQLEAVSREPVNAAVAAAQIALGTLHHLATTRPGAEAFVVEGLRHWQSLDTPQPPSPQGTLARDVADIRAVLFKPHGDGIFATAKIGWNAFKWASVSAPYFLVQSSVRVKLHTSDVTRVTAYDRLPAYENVVFLDDERRSMLDSIMTKLGGRKKRAWVNVMATPNQPAGDSLHVLTLWRKMFWAQPGHWGGWVFESYPTINEIEFVDAARTRAAVKVTVGYSGATVQMEKKDGVWIAKELTNFWVT